MGGKPKREMRSKGEASWASRLVEGVRGGLSEVAESDKDASESVEANGEERAMLKERERSKTRSLHSHITLELLRTMKELLLHPLAPSTAPTQPLQGDAVPLHFLLLDLNFSLFSTVTRPSTSASTAPHTLPCPTRRSRLDLATRLKRSQWRKRRRAEEGECRGVLH
jgi:hypothetical protein